MNDGPVPGLSAELFWLAATALMTALFWLPYVLERVAARGLWAAHDNPAPNAAPASPWARRAMAAHANAVENLAVFAPLVLVVVMASRGSAMTAGAAAVYFFARLAHFAVYAAGVPVLRTLAFAVGWAACLVLAGAAPGML